MNISDIRNIFYSFSLNAYNIYNIKNNTIITECPKIFTKIYNEYIVVEVEQSSIYLDGNSNIDHKRHYDITYHDIVYSVCREFFNNYKFRSFSDSINIKHVPSKVKYKTFGLGNSEISEFIIIKIKFKDFYDVYHNVFDNMVFE